MRHLIKIAALIYALFSLASCSRLAENDNLTNNSKSNNKSLIFEGGFGIKIKGVQKYEYGSSKPIYYYTMDGFYKDFRVRTVSGEKIHKIDYVIEFDYSYPGSHTEHHALKVVSDYIDPFRSTVMYQNVIMEANQSIIDGTGVPVQSFHNGVVTIQAYTNLGNTLKLTLYNVPIQLN